MLSLLARLFMFELSRFTRSTLNACTILMYHFGTPGCKMAAEFVLLRNS